MISIKTTIPALCLLISFACHAQADSIVKRINDEFRAGRLLSMQERIRNGIYNREGFKRYKGKIEILSYDAIRYDSTIFKIYIARPEYKTIFEKGIFYPGIFSGNQTGEREEDGERLTRPDSISALGSCFTNYNIIGVDVLEEIKLQENTYTTRRFKLWQWNCAFANPREYIFELTNDSATSTTDLSSFIENSKLTYFRFITIII